MFCVFEIKTSPTLTRWSCPMLFGTGFKLLGSAVYSENWCGASKSSILNVAPEQCWIYLLLAWKPGTGSRGVLSDQHFPGSGLNFPLYCSYFMCSWLWLPNLDISSALHWNNPLESQSLWPWSLCTQGQCCVSGLLEQISANWFHPSEGVYQQHCTLISGFHFLILFCKYIRYLELEYTKCKYSSCICTNSDPFAV